MSYNRENGRKLDELRPISAKVGVIPNADGSAMFQIGNTKAYAAVYGPRELYPRFLQNPSKGILRVNYNMMPFAGHGDRVRPGPNRRSKEISLVAAKALAPVVDLSQFPNAVVDVFIELPQTDAGTRCAGICAASMALADAGLPMRDLVASMSMGYMDGSIVADIDAHEDCDLGATDIPVAFLPNSNKLTLMQMDGKISQPELKKLLDVGLQMCKKINAVQVKALKAKYEVQK